MPDLRVLSVGLDDVEAIWPLVEGFIEASESCGDTGVATRTVGDVRARVMSGASQLWVAVDGGNAVHGVAVMQFYDEPLHRIAWITALGGRMLATKAVQEQFIMLVKANGATMVKGAVRPSMSRLFGRLGYVPSCIILEKLL